VFINNIDILDITTWIIIIITITRIVAIFTIIIINDIIMAIAFLFNELPWALKL